MKQLLVLVVAAVTMWLPSRALAWHNRGHNAVARIAWNRLIELGLDAKAIEILNSHPHRDLYLLAERPEGVEPEEWMFVQAATWADWVRRPLAPELNEESSIALADEFNKPVWHYINLPYIHPSEPDGFDEAALRKTMLDPERDEQGQPRHVVAALKHNYSQLAADDVTPRDRAVALCWLLHLTGDLHQPLHAVGLIGTRASTGNEDLLPPSGDQGGNRLAIRTSVDLTNAMALHFYWDALVLADVPYSSVQARVRTWLNDPAFQRRTFGDALNHIDFLEWAEESHALAKAVAYQDQGKFLKAQSLPDRYPRTMLENLPAPVVSDEYQKQAHETAQRRIVLAGYRLGDMLTAPLQKLSN
jgi:hypothetical protein